MASEVNPESGSPVYSEGKEPYQLRYRWVMLALIWILYVVFGVILRSISPLITPIMADLNISYSQMGLVLGAWPLTYVAVAVVGGTVIDKLGIRKSLFAGIIIIGLSEALRYYANSFGLMFLCVALIGFGGPMISIGAPKLIAVWFRGKNRGTAAGVYMTGPWIGGLVAYALTNSVVMPFTGYSWRLTFVVYSLLAFAAALLWWFLARDAKSTEAAKSTSLAKVFSGLIRIRNVQLLIIIGFLSFAIVHGFNDWLPKILETNGLSPELAGFVASLSVAVGIPAVLIVSHVSPPHLRGRVIALLSVVTAITIPAVVILSDAPMIVSIALYGAATCAIIPLPLLLLMETPEVGSRYMGSAGGMFFCVAEIGGFVGPLIIGILVDMTGSFLAGTSILAVMSLVTGAIALSVKTQPVSRPEASP
ncbi:CynX/NimT family MFS transporter [Chloroflexota bacterium]